MNKTLHISGSIIVIALAILRSVPYFEGIAFNKFWFIPLSVLPIGLIAFLIFTASAIVCLISITRKKTSTKKLYAIFMAPALVVGVFNLPFPSYVDGMHKTVSESLSHKQLMELAIDARTVNPEWLKEGEHDQLIQYLKIKYPKALSLSQIPPRIDVSGNYISVFYGSSLVKHWGYVVSDLEVFPIEHIPKYMYKKVYAGVWVYHDIW
jgi:hypothetical protein